LKHLLLVALLLPIAAHADDYILTIKDHKFQPAELTIPSDAKIKLKVENQDGIPVEFESTDLSREVIVPGHGEVTIYVGPLKPGNYQFFNDFNRDMRGTIVAKPAVDKEN
jgi:hypothetical protein